MDSYASSFQKHKPDTSRLRGKKDKGMPASRWNYTLKDLLDWIGESREDFLNLTLNPIQTHVSSEESPEETLVGTEEKGTVNIPEILPILPLRGVVVYPQTAVPLTVGQPRSIRLVDDVVAGDRLIGLVAAKDPELENPGPDDLYTIGTVATIHRLFRTPDGMIRILIQGLARFRVVDFIQTEPYLKARLAVDP